MPVNVKPLKSFGYPPDTDNRRGRYQRHNFLPMVEISPLKPTPKAGLHLFDVTDASTEYKKDFKDIADALGFADIREVDLPIQVAFLAETFPSETFSSEYGESFLERFADVASGGLSEVSYMMGASDVGELVSSIEKGAKGAGGIIGTAGKALGWAKGQTEELVKELGTMGKAGRGLATTLKAMGKLVVGGRVDMPQIWKNSSYAVSYAITVRLYNPDPSSDAATENFVLAPLTALLLYILPRSRSFHGGERTEGIYHFPYLCSLNCPGVFNLPAAFVSSVNIIKGGDAGLYGMNQHIGMIDVRIEFGSLFNTMVQGIQSEKLPNLYKYIQSLQSKRKIKRPIRRIIVSASTKTSSEPADASIPASSRVSATDTSRTNSLTPNIPGPIRG